MTESQVIAIVRPQVVERDGFCRLGKNLLAAMGPCSGPSEWAHLGDSRRNNTKHLPAEERHTVAGSIMLCRGHHRQYDGHILGARAERLWIEELTPDRANGALAFTRDGRRFEEKAA